MTFRYLSLGNDAAVVRTTLGLDEATLRSILDGPPGQLAGPALAAPQTSFGGTELPPTLPEKAAVLVERLIVDHPLPNGSKRCATVTTHLFPHVNGSVSVASDDDLEELAWRVAARSLDLEALTHCMRASVATAIRARPRHSPHLER